MPKLRTAAIAGVATLLFAGAAVAATAKFHTMQVSLPDGSVAHITYAGDVAPKVAIEPMDGQAAAYVDPFAAMDHDLALVSAMMEVQNQQAMQQIAAIQRRAAAGGGASLPGQVIVNDQIPAGSSYSYTVVSSSNGQSSCTQTVEWRSNGASKQPRVTRASSGDCGAVKGGEGDKPVPASATQKTQSVDPRSI